MAQVDPRAKTAVKIAATALLYMLTGQLGLLLAVPPGYATIIWPASGIAVGALLTHGRLLAVGVFVGSFVLNAAHGGAFTAAMGWAPEKLVIAAAIATGSSLQALLAHWLVGRFLGSPVNLKRAREIVLLFVLAGPLSCIIAATIGVSALYLAGKVVPGELANNWLTWWTGDVLGIAVFLPIVLLAPKAKNPLRWRGSPLGSLPTAAILVILLPLGLTFYAWKASSSFMHERHKEIFASLALENAQAFSHRLSSYNQGLLGAVGFIKGSDYVSASEWEMYVDALVVGTNYPGIYGIGFIQNVEPSDLQKFQAAAQLEQPGFAVHPQRPGGPYFIIRNISPEAKNHRAIGLNIAFEQNRLKAALLARDSGKAAITGRIVLVQDQTKKDGFLALYPMYRTGASTASVAERRAALLGWVYAPFVAQDFMRAITVSQGDELTLKVYDGSQASADHLIYDNSPRGSHAVPAFTTQKTIDVMQRPWTFVWSSTPRFEARFTSNEPLLALCGGLMCTALFAALLFMLAHRAQMVRKLVDEKTAELQRATEEATLAKANAEQASEAKTAFLATMSHEIRTPLNGIIGYTDFLLDAKDLSAQYRRYAERIAGSGAALLTVVNDILDFSSIEAGQIELDPRPFYLKALVDNAMSIVGNATAQKGLHTAIYIDPSVPAQLVGDEDRLRQILLNLLNNAVKFTATGSVILTVQRIEGLGDGGMRFTVRDTGVGIAADKRDRLFKRFSQVDGSVRRAFGGSGLGLAISKHLIEMMGGRIGFESAPGVGSTFWFEVALPQANEAEASAVDDTHTIECRAATILLVDDVEINRLIASAVLRDAGHEVDIVCDGVEAVAAVQAKTYDVVLMDVQMPGMDGLTATRLIRKLPAPACETPIVALTANVLPFQVAEFRKAGMVDHVGKPFKKPELLAAIARHVSATPDEWRDLQPGSEPAAESSGFDPGVLSDLEGFVGPNEIRRLLEQLASELRKRVPSASPDGLERDVLRDNAHALISSSAMMGFLDLSTACRDVETACTDGSDLSAHVVRLVRAQKAALARIESLKAA